MPYALIPDGYSLKKVTKLQKQALNDKRRHDDVLAFIANPELMKQIIISGVAFLAVKEGQQVIDDLKEAGANISDATVSAYRKKRDVGDAPVGVSIEQVVDEALKRLTNLI